MQWMACAVPERQRIAAMLAQRLAGRLCIWMTFTCRLNSARRNGEAEPGGNVHYREVFSGSNAVFKRAETFHYGKFSDEILDIAEEITIEPGSLLIVEGAYSMRPELRNAYDLTICVLSPAELQKQRLIRREGEEGYLEYRDLWIPLETAYLEHLRH